MPECVILIHGLGRTSFCLALVHWWLQCAGWHVATAGYPSHRLTVQQIADTYIDRVVREQSQGGTVKLNFVTHSMGGIVLRQYLATHTVTNLGRVVMLAPPNHGSEVVDALKKCAVGRWILGTGGAELGTAGVPGRIGPARFELGVIAGDRSADPWFAHLFHEPNDGKVSVESAKVDGMADFLVVHQSHTWMMWHPATVRQILAFLERGRFERGGR